MQSLLSFQNSFVLRVASLIIALPALISCGGGGSACQAGVVVLFGASCSSSDSNTAPLANPGITQNVQTGSLVDLDGSGSSDAEKNTLSYKWELIDRPATSSADLIGPTSVNPPFTADRSGTYT